MRLAHRAFSRALAERLSSHDITATQWTALRALWGQDGYSQVELAQRINIEKAALTAVLDGLERKGLVQRSRSKEDRRIYNVHLTKTGKDLEKILLPLADEVNALASRGFSSKDVKMFLGMLGKVVDNLS